MKHLSFEAMISAVDAETCAFGAATSGIARRLFVATILALGAETSAIAPSYRRYRCGVLGKGSQTLGKVTRMLGKGNRTLGKGTRTLGKGTLTLGKGTRTLGKGTRTLGKGTQTLGKGTWTGQTRFGRLGLIIN